MSKRAKLRIRRRRSERLRASYGKLGLPYLHKKFEGEYLVPTVQELGFDVIIQGLIPENLGDEDLKRLWNSKDVRLAIEREAKRQESESYLELLSHLRRHPAWVMSNYLGECGARISYRLFSDVCGSPLEPSDKYDPFIVYRPNDEL